MAAALGVVVLGFALYHVVEIEHSDVYYLTVSMLAAAGCGLLILGCQATSGVLRAAFSFLPVRFVGVIGYSVFLWHFPLIVNAENYPILASMSSLMRFVTVVAIILPLVLVVGTVLYLLVEKPFIENRGAIEKTQAPAEHVVATSLPLSTAVTESLPVLLRLPRDPPSAAQSLSEEEIPTLRVPAVIRSHRRGGADSSPPPA